MDKLMPETQLSEHTAVDIATFTAAAVAAARQFGGTRPWWRGQLKANWPLRTSLHRKGFESKEINLNARFRMMARARHANCPSSEDALGWLFLMQHYRLPTRLLDWTQSALVALYFALEEPDDSDAAVWALSPTGLNLVEAEKESICLPGSKTLGRLGIQAFRPDNNPRDERILSVLTEEADARHMVQQSAFTLHGRSETLDEHPGRARFLMRIRIPAVAKRGLRQVLALFGVNRASIFPDLENLAAELAQMDFSDVSRFLELSGGPADAS